MTDWSSFDFVLQRRDHPLGHKYLPRPCLVAQSAVEVWNCADDSGFAIAVSDEAITAAVASVAQTDGLLLSPEGGATMAAYTQALADGRVRQDERVVLFNCAIGLKYPMPPVHASLDRTKPIDFSKLL